MRGLSTEEIARLSEGMCPWRSQCRSLEHGWVDKRDGSGRVAYTYCFARDIFIRLTEGRVEMIPVEQIFHEGWEYYRGL